MILGNMAFDNRVEEIDLLGTSPKEALTSPPNNALTSRFAKSSITICQYVLPSVDAMNDDAIY